MDISERTRQNKGKYRTEPLRGKLKSARYQMRLFIVGNEPNSATARKNIGKICSENLKGDYKLDVIDVFEDFSAAIEENILVSPALLMDKPKKVKIFGNLDDEDKVLSALGLI